MQCDVMAHRFRTLSAIVVSRFRFYSPLRSPLSFSRSCTRWSQLNRLTRAAKVLLFGSLPVVVMAKIADPSVADIVKRTDELDSANKMREAYEYISQYAHIDDVEIHNRVARECYYVSKYYAKDNNEAKSLANEGLKHAEMATKLDPNNYRAFRWMGILLNSVSEFEGYKVKIEKSFEIREHFDKAKELKPDDPYGHYLIGQWCYSVASVSWYMRKAASLIFATPPTATYEEALGHFMNAEKREPVPIMHGLCVEPGFYCSNWVFIGRCHYQLGNKEEAKEWLTKAAQFDGDGADEKEAKQEANELLKKV